MLLTCGPSIVCLTHGGMPASSKACSLPVYAWYKAFSGTCTWRITSASVQLVAYECAMACLCVKECSLQGYMAEWTASMHAADKEFWAAHSKATLFQADDDNPERNPASASTSETLSAPQPGTAAPRRGKKVRLWPFSLC